MTLMANGKKVLGYALGDTEFYSIDDSDTSVTASGKTWYAIDDSDTSVTASGKTWYAIPSQVTIKQGTDLTYPNKAGEDGTITETVQQDSEVNCVGANANHYFFTGYIGDSDQVDDGHVLSYNFQEEEGCGVGEVLKSDCTNIVW